MVENNENAKKASFEDSLAELEKIVSQIESGQIGLEGSIARYEKGIKLIRQCRSILEAAEKKIQVLAKAHSGGLEVTGEQTFEDESQK
jgi:exodeoxyribonuclease VII small subunit